VNVWTSAGKKEVTFVESWLL